MPDVIGIRFKKCGKIYDYEVDAMPVSIGDLVVVESNFGLAIGSVVTETKSVENPQKELKKVLRSATEEDLRAKADNDSIEKEAREYCQQRIIARELPMKLVLTESTLDRKRIVFYFTADGRIDFRELVKDLASRFRTRIEMRQIGVRDETKVIGGLGICGREVCCNCFLSSFAPISIRMAKSQDLVLNPGKLSGLCGRLMCCLGFEVDSGAEPTGDVIELRDDGTTGITAVIDGKSLSTETIEDASILAFLEKKIKTEKPPHKYNKGNQQEVDAQQQAPEQTSPSNKEAAQPAMEQKPAAGRDQEQKRFDPNKRRFHKKVPYSKPVGTDTAETASSQEGAAVTPAQSNGQQDNAERKKKFHFKKHKKIPPKPE
ncbi:MAG: stage 0 sporulation protein [Nitrospirae bacterium]|nr:stage 0 sporulation protein [Nitrospirota bacterium]MBF0533647.1 stage 0 sporulation protein [Nitrospirota bacterium]MBF0616702.1 stage 0 sporulation protein [Nitrospirota bacterium]